MKSTDRSQCLGGRPRNRLGRITILYLVTEQGRGGLLYPMIGGLGNFASTINLARVLPGLRGSPPIRECEHK